MLVVARSRTYNADNPGLHEYFIADGVLMDVFALEYVIERLPSDGSAPVQVWPESGRAEVDLAADRLGPGHYAATWAVPSDAAIGAYRIAWFVTYEEDGEEYAVHTPFEVLTAITTAGPLYAPIWSMRAEGFTSTVTYPDHVLHAKLVLASRMFEAYTARFFEPRYKALKLDGRNKRDLLLDEPIIGIESVTMLSGSVFATNSEIDLESLRVYNRHLTQGLLDPDDREAPRISFHTISDYEHERHPELSIDCRRFPKGTQNILVRGVFGYTEPDGSTTGQTPLLVQRAVQLLAARELPTLADIDGRDQARNHWNVVSERTRDQQITRFSGVDAASRAAMIGAITGDPEIDRIIVLFKRGVQIGAA